MPTPKITLSRAAAFPLGSGLGRCLPGRFPLPSSRNISTQVNSMMRFLLLMPAIGSILAASVFGQAGVSFCTPFPNSTGTPTALTGSFGNGVGSGLHLEVTDGVPGQFSYVLVGNEATSGVLISNGVFCLVSTPTARVFRYNISGGELNSSGNFDNQGVFQNSVGTSLVGSGFDVPDTIPASLFTPILAGSTWHFQVWHRDDPAGAGTSTFSNGLSVTFQAGPIRSQAWYRSRLVPLTWGPTLLLASPTRGDLRRNLFTR